MELNRVKCCSYQEKIMQTNKKQDSPTQITVDATKQSLGRVASQVASLLMGKNRADFARNIAPNVQVTVTNASKVGISDRKKRGEIYVWNTGYPGGKREEKLGHRLERKGYDDVFRSTVYGMLPANRLRSKMMKNLNIEL
jgi:large subunit ribosomal protein L13